MGTARSLRSSMIASSGMSLLALLWMIGCDFHPAAQSTSISEDGGTALTLTGGGGASGGGSTNGKLGSGAHDGGALGGAGGAAGAASGTGGAPTCPAQCPSGQVCLGGACQPDPCLAAAPSCATGTTCRATCVTVTDPCAGKTCPDGQTCVSGACTAGCFLEPCNGVTCPSGQYCNPGTGACVMLDACDAACGPGKACDLTCASPNPCAGVKCAANQLCSGGTCVANLCAGVKCAAGSICSNGTCLDTCSCGKSCGSAGHCIQGSCVCTPVCPTDGSRAGLDDGCAGLCPCPTGSTQVTNGCCMPNCPADGSRGGMSDGCGKTCACAKGSALYNGACCTPNCPANGSNGGKSNGCGGTCSCATGSTLYMGACCTANCPTDGSRGGMSDGCGKSCACPSGDVLYGGSCCKPVCPSDGSNGGKSDSCGGTCACATGSALYMGACCKPACPGDGSNGGKPDGCGKTCACPSDEVALRELLLHAELPQRREPRRPERRLWQDLRVREGERALQRRLLRADLPGRRQPRRDGRRLREDLRLSGHRGAFRRWLLPADLPEQWNLRRLRRLRWHLRLRRRRQVHQRPLSRQDLHADLRLRADLQQRPVRRHPVRSGRRSVRVRLLQLRRVLHRRPVHGQHQPRLSVTNRGSATASRQRGHQENSQHIVAAETGAGGRARLCLRHGASNCAAADPGSDLRARSDGVVVRFPHRVRGDGWRSPRSWSPLRSSTAAPATCSSRARPSLGQGTAILFAVGAVSHRALLRARSAVATVHCLRRCHHRHAFLAGRLCFLHRGDLPRHLSLRLGAGLAPDSSRCRRGRLRQRRVLGAVRGAGQRLDERAVRSSTLAAGLPDRHRPYRRRCSARCWAVEVVHVFLSKLPATAAAMAAIHALVPVARSPQHVSSRGSGDCDHVLRCPPRSCSRSPATSAPGRWPSTNPPNWPALEAQFPTERGAPLRLGGWPDSGDAHHPPMPFVIPHGLSFLAFHHLNAEVRRARFVSARRSAPTPSVVHVAFQVMVGRGSALALVGSLVAVPSGSQRNGRVPYPNDYCRCGSVVARGPLGFLALEAGWAVSEVGSSALVSTASSAPRDAVTPVTGLDRPVQRWSPSSTSTSALVVAILLGRLFLKTREPRMWMSRRCWDRRILAALILYFLFGGADFGGGVWHLLATGPRVPAAGADCPG